jgi:hypothetical protein
MNVMSFREPGPKPGMATRMALRLFPPAWRARYAGEVLDLLADSGAGPLAAAGLAWHAPAAWVQASPHLYDRPGRMRSSLATVLMAWTALAGLAVVFFQLAQVQTSLQLSTLAHHPVISLSYWLFDGAALVSVLVMVVGGLSLWLLMLRTAFRAHRRREAIYLLAPVIVPALYLILAAFTVVAVRVAHGGGTPGSVMPGQSKPVVDLANGMVGPGWFLALVVAGFAAAALSAAGPALALRRLRPRGPGVTLAVRAAGIAAATMALAGMASVVAVIGLYLWAPSYAGYHQGWQLAIYLPGVALAAVVAVVSARRGVRAARPTAA